ncbi:hypothetical protein GGR57DRAFT_300637 [Xylariaceae sp. FL1272]|nr:hypothetical protein GGR57DRAFT_300637 [Xylariaceae sp. FL1272]
MLINKPYFNQFAKKYRKRDLQELLNRPWFSRIWTFQEIVLACDCVFICGEYTMSMDTMVRGIGYLHDISSALKSPKLLPTAWVYHGSLIEDDSVNNQDTVNLLIPTSTDTDISIELPRALETFYQVLRLWLTAKRPSRGTAIQDRLRLGVMSSFYDIQRPFGYVHRWVLNAETLWLQTLLLILVTYRALPTPFAFSKEWVAILIIPLWVLWGLFVFFLFFIPIWAWRYLPQRNYFAAKRSRTTDGNDTADGILQTLTSRKASNPRDRSYGLYGVLGNGGVHLSSPDYKKSEGQTYNELFVDLLRWNPQAFPLLVNAGESLVVHDGPSWVPGWDSLPDEPIMPLQARQPYTMHRCAIHADDATRGSQPDFELPNNNQTLRILGHLKDHVTFCTGTFQEICTPVPDNKTLRSHIMAILSWIGEVTKTTLAVHYSDSIERQEYIRNNYETGMETNTYTEVSTMSPNQSLPCILYFLLKRTSAASYTDQQFRRLREVFNILTPEHTSQYGTTNERLSVDQISDKISQDESLFKTFVEIINNLAKKTRRLFVTSEGFLGCASTRIVVGDMLALVSGLPAPLVLRPKVTGQDWYSTEYTVMSPAFVLGWMQGEVYEESKAEYIDLV